MVEELHSLADDLDRHWLAGASEEAQSEWRSFLNEWPTEFEVRRGLVARSESELAWMLAKAERFRAILGDSAATA
jgi:hypothetical protein